MVEFLLCIGTGIPGQGRVVCSTPQAVQAAVTTWVDMGGVVAQRLCGVVG
jgi:hypothetical protein